MPENNYSIKITVQAETELKEIIGYISNVFFAEETAEKVLVRITKNIEQLKTMPYSAPLMDEPEYSEIGIHWLVAKNYSIFYLINEEKKQVEIIHILHGMQDYTQRLT